MTRRLVRLAGPAAVAAALAMVCTQVFTAHPNWQSSALSAVLAVGITLSWLGVMNHIDAGYRKRMSAGHAAQWDVWLNGALLGTLTDAEYATCQQHAFRAGRCAGAQLWNIVCAIRRIAWWAASSVTVIVVWMGVAGAIAAPEALIAAVQDILRANVATLPAAGRDLGISGMNVCLIGVLTLAYGASLFGTRKFGLRDRHAQAVGRLLRGRFRTAADGEVFVCAAVSEVATAERAFVRT